jgi:hypothetical protein
MAGATRPDHSRSRAMSCHFSHNETEKIGLAMKDLDWLAAGDHNHEGPGTENREPGDTPAVIRDREYTLQAAEALRLAHENKLAPIDPKEVRAAKAEITETHVKAAYVAAWAWDNLAKQLEQLKSDRGPEPASA